ncbi:MAG: BON domain-containing protein [Armatimonadota bacterium]
MEITDGHLVFQVERAIGQLPGVNLNDLRVTADKGVVTIRGAVRTLADKMAALEAASQIPGVRSVIEAVAVEIPHQVPDQQLSQDLDEEIAEAEIDPRRLGADAIRGQAVLTGSARSLGELSRAEVAAEGVTGISNSYDTTRIENPYGPDQADLANAVADALRRHPDLKHRQIRPLVEETGHVVLVGQVHSEEERLLALQVTTTVAGVHSAREELAVVP